MNYSTVFSNKGSFKPNLGEQTRSCRSGNQSTKGLLVQAYLRWTEDNASAAAYDTLRTIRAYLKGDGHFSPGDLWTRHLLARCFILEAREPNVGEKQVRLRGEALQYCTELKGELSNATEPLVSPEDIAKMEELISLERSVFESEPHPSALQKFKVKASGFFGRS